MTIPSPVGASDKVEEDTSAEHADLDRFMSRRSMTSWARVASVARPTEARPTPRATRGAEMLLVLVDVRWEAAGPVSGGIVGGGLRRAYQRGSGRTGMALWIWKRKMNKRKKEKV